LPEPRKKKGRGQTVIKIFTPFSLKVKIFFAGTHFSRPVNELRHMRIFRSNSTEETTTV